MTNAKKIIGLFLLISIVIVPILAHAVFAQENVTKEDILTEAQRNFDRSLSILNIVASSMGALVGLITIIIVIAIAVGVFEYNKWKSMRNKIEEKVKDIEKDVHFIRKLRNKAEKDANTLRNELEKIPPTPLTEKPSKETMEKLDEFSRRLELLEVLGFSLKPDDYIQRGNDLYYKGKYELALIAFEKAIGLKSDNYSAWYMKATVLFLLGRYDEALKTVDKAIELKPDHDNALVLKGCVLGVDEIGRDDEAIKAFERAIELKPDNPIAWHGKGLILRDVRPEDALKAFEKAIELKSDYVEAWDNKGAVLGKLNRHEEALKAFEKAIELKPDYASAWYNLACAYSLKGDKEKALSDLEKAIELDKSYKEKAKTDKDFEWLWDDKDFKKLVD